MIKSLRVPRARDVCVTMSYIHTFLIIVSIERWCERLRINVDEVEVTLNVCRLKLPENMLVKLTQVREGDR